MSVDIIQGECRQVLAGLATQSVHAVITSPPYFGLRSYGGGVQEIGAEQTPQEYVAHLVEAFRAVHRVLRDDGVLWVVIGDSYNAYNGNRGASPSFSAATEHALPRLPKGNGLTVKGLKNKDLMMIPHRVALALQDDGWYVRNDCVWAKGSAMPESVQDRFSRAHEYVFHLAKSERYYFDPLAVAEPCVKGAAGSLFTHGKTGINGLGRVSQAERADHATRNRRSVLHVNPQPFSAADFGVKDIDHYAVFPEKLVEILTLCSTSEAGCCPRCAAPWRRVVEREPGTWEDRKEAGAPMRYGVESPKGTALNRMGESSTTTTGWQAGCACNAGPPLACTTLDPFLGSGTTALVSKRLGRSCVGIELKGDYVKLAERRVASIAEPLFTAATAGLGPEQIQPLDLPSILPANGTNGTGLQDSLFDGCANNERERCDGHSAAR